LSNNLKAQAFIADFHNLSSNEFPLDGEKNGWRLCFPSFQADFLLKSKPQLTFTIGYLRITISFGI